MSKPKDRHGDAAAVTTPFLRVLVPLCGLIVLCVTLASGGTAAASQCSPPAPSSPCSVYPIIVPEALLQGAAVGAELRLSDHDWSSGAAGWLTWTGSNSANALAESLLPPGNVATYINPDNPADHRLDVGDWVQSSPGHTWSRAVRDNLGLLLDHDIRVPTFVTERGHGGQLDYRVARFITIRIVGLTVHKSIRFEYRGPSLCGATNLVAADQSLQTSEETPLPIQLTATSSANVPLSYLVVAAPSHGTLAGQPPNLVYTPGPHYQGDDQFTFRATAGAAQSNVATVSITVTPVNDPPFFTGAPGLEVHDGELYAYLAVADDLDVGDMLTWSLGDAPQGMSIDAGSGLVSWLPTFADVGQHVVTIVVTDSAGASATQTFALRVVHPAPIAIAQQVAVDEDGALAIVLEGESARTLAFTVLGAPQHGVLTGVAPDLSYTPDLDYAGPDSFTFAASDGALSSNVAAVSIEVRPVNDPPRITTSAVVVASDRDDYRYWVVAEDVDPGDRLTFRLVEAPAGMAIDDATGLIQWSPTVLDVGTHPVAVEVRDLAGATAGQDFIVTVVHPAPVAVAQGITTDEDAVVAVTLSAVSPLPLQYEVVELPSHGTLTGQAPELTYVPAADYHGPDRVTFRATDGVAFSDIAAVTIAVAPVNDPPRITSLPVLEAVEDQRYEYAVTAVDVDEGDALAFALVDAPPGVLVDADTGVVTWVPRASDAGTHVITVAVTDLAGARAEQTYAVAVAFANRPPAIVSTPELDAVQGGYAYQVTVADPDPGDHHTFGLLRPVGGMGIDDGGRLTWDTAGWAGNNRLRNTTCAAGGESTFGPPPAVDVVAVVDESNSMRGEHAWLADVGAPLEAHLVTRSVGVDAPNRYGLAGFERDAHPIPVGAGNLGGHVDFIAATSTLALGGGTEDGYKALHTILATYPLRADAGRNVILVSDEDRDVVDATLTYASTLAELTAAKVMLNVVVDANFHCADGSEALGMGQNGIGYQADGHGGFVTCAGVTATDTTPPADGPGTAAPYTAVADYVALALATGGAAWDLKVLRAGGLDAQSFTTAFLEIKVREILDQLPTRDLADGYVHSLRAVPGAIEVDVGNRGLVALAGTTTVNIYADDALVATRTVDDLGAAAHQTWTVPWAPAATTPPSRLSVVLTPSGPECGDANNQLAAAWVGVRATDRGGLYDEQHFSLQVVDRNDPPQITSTPSLTATVERRHRATVTAIDPDRGDGLAFALAHGPAGMTIHPRLGVIDYVPDAAQVGEHEVEVVVRDLAGAEARQPFTLTVGTTGRPPRFTSAPPWRALRAIPYSYDPQVAADPGAALRFDAFLAPPGFHVDVATGHVDWLPPDDFAGKTARVLLRVIDGEGNYDLQQYILYGDAINLAPEIASLAPLTAQTGTTYTYAAAARDANVFEQLTWRSVALPPGATLTPAATSFPSSNANATVTWPDVSATHPAGMEAPDPWCATRDPSVSPLAPGAVWARTGVNQVGQPVVGPIADTNLDGRLSSADLTAIAFVATSDVGSATPRLHVLDARTGEGLWIYSQRTPEPAVQPAIVDLDGGGQATILFVDKQRHLVALRADGTLRWASAAPIAATDLRYNAISVSDLDGDGDAEILVGPAVYGHDGTLAWAFPAAPVFERGEALAIDVDGDGQREVLYRGELRDAHGLLRERLYTAAAPSLQYAFYAPLRLPGDPRLYVVASERTSAGYALRLLDADGAQVWSAPGQLLAAGPVIVEDLTGDGEDDIYVASLGSLYSSQGQLVWHTVEHASPLSDAFHVATVADLDQDGEWEIISPRPGTVDIVAGRTGAVLWRRVGKTVDVAQTAPLVDLDGDGDATLFLVESQAVRAYRSARAPWPATTRVWQQRSLAADEMGDDLRPRAAATGGAPAPRYVVSAPGAVAQATVFLPDLRVAGLSGDVEGQPGIGRLSIDVNNRGTRGSRPATVDVYRDMIRVGTVAVPVLAPHQKVNLPMPLAAAAVGDAELRTVVVADPADTECSTANNVASSRVMAVAIEDYGELEDLYRWAARVDERMVAPTITSTPPVTAVEHVRYRHQLVATSPHAGDVLTYQLSQAPDGATIDPLTGEVTWTPPWGRVGAFPFGVLVTSRNGLTAGKSWTVTVTASPEANTPPVITSTPLAHATAGQAYRYDVVASDPEGQRVTYRLEVAPPGMAIDSARGILLWLPTAAAVVPVRLVATDERGASTRQDFDVRVYATANQAPVLASAPPLVVNVGATYRYDVVASDPDGDPLAYAWTVPAGAVAAARALTWTPGAAEAGEHAAAVEIRDDRGGTVRQRWTVFVNDPADNATPQIASVPAVRAVAGRAYAYQVVATDGDGDPLTYALARAPAGMAIDASGLVRWTPALTALGDHAVQVQASDGRGGVTWQSFTLRVVLPGATNGAPSIASAAPLSAKVGRTYAYPLVASDPDGDALAFTLVDGPAGMSLHPQTGRVTWSPAATGPVDVRVSVSDGALVTEQAWTVTVVAADAALAAQLRVAPDLVSVDEAVAIELVVENASGPTEGAVLVDGAPVALDGHGRASVRSAVLGAHVVTATVIDGPDQAVATGGFTVLDDSGAGAPTVTIADPIDGDSVTAPVVVTGGMADDDLAGWRLQLADHEGHPPITLASGVAAIDGALGTLDPTRLQNGLYTLTLRAWDLAGHEGKVAVEVVVEGELKIGHFAVAFEDATVPLGGIPITVTRAYDTRRAHEPLDFGYGWSVDYQAMRVQESRTVGARWRLTYQSQGLFGDWCVEPVGRPVVTVVRPDGKLEKFKPVAVPACNFLVPMTDVGIAFEPLPGTHSQLEQGDYDTVRLIGGDLVDLGDTDDTDVGPADPSQYTLTMADGTAYDLEQGVGMRRVTDLDGNSVVFGPNGIEHSSGVGIQFVRDAEGRIAQMRLPDGGTLRYTYNNAGELVTVADPLARTTRFAYAAGAAVPHYLRDIVDARGVRMSRVEYDASGRMVAHIDADGHRTELATDFVGSVHTVRDALGQVTTLTFDPRGNVTREQNPLGEVTLHTYDERGNELSRTDGEGRVTRWTYDAEDNQTSQTDGLGQVTRWTHDARGQIVSQTEPDGTVSMANVYHPSRGHLMQTTDAVGNTTLLGYGDRGELVVLRRPQGDVTSYEHDYRGLPTREVAANGAVVEYTHDAVGRVLTETRRATDAAGVAHALVTTHTYDAAGQRLTTMDPLGRVARTEYDAAGQVVAEIDPSGDRTELTYDLAGRLALTRYPDGTTEQPTYDALGRQVATVDRAGRTTTMTYDAAGRLIRTRFADGAEVATTYDLAGRVATQVDARGGVTRFGYDAAGRRVTTVDPLGATTTTTYTATGRRAGVQDALGRTTKYVYDAAGKLTATLYPDLTAGDADNPRTLQSYDALGRVTSRTDEVGRVTRYEYAVTGQLVAVVDAAGGRTELTYDQRGNKVSQRDALGRVTLFEYDAVGQETARVLPGGQRSTRSYDGEGRLAREVDENGAATDYVYDRDDRVIEVRYADGLRSTTTYTASGQIATVTDREGGVTTRAYDAVDRLVRVSYPDGVRLDFAYDASGHRTSVTTTTAAGARAVSYGYDAAGRMTTVDDGAGAMSYRYSAAGEVVELQRPNGVRSEYGYDVRSRPALFVERAANGNEVNRITYATDRSGLRTGVTEQGTFANRTISYQYDALRRLGRETLTDGHPQGQRVTAWTYDAVGNRLTETQTRGASVATVASTYDSNDRLERELAASGALVTYGYDAAGQTTTRTETTGPSTAVTTYTYDAAHRLAAATGPAGAMSYGYDADGIRQSETVDGVTTRFVFDPTQPYPQVIAELGGAAGPAAETHYAIGLGGGTRLTRRQAGVTTYLHTDALGSLRLATTAAGAIAERWAYRPFGAVDVHLSGAGAPLPNTGPGVHTFLFAGEQYEPGLDLYYLRARHYAPASGRFTQADVYRGSDGDPLSLHRYAYAHGNPVTNRDPSGYVTTMELTGTQLVLNTLRTLALTVPRLGASLTTKTVLSTVAFVGSAAVVGVTATEIVRRCMAGGLAGIGPCRSPINIFFLGAPQGEHTQHVDDAIAGGYARLLRRKLGLAHDRGWLDAHRGPGLRCENSTAASSNDCDEYPYGATEEGGQRGHVSLRTVNLSDNRSGGALLGAFYKRCSVPAGPSAPPFLVVASRQIPLTGSVCKN